MRHRFRKSITPHWDIAAVAVLNFLEIRLRDFPTASGPVLPRRFAQTKTLFAGLTVALLCASCDRQSNAPTNAASDSQLTSHGTLEVTAKLVEIPDGAIFKRDLYDYATVLKYDVVKVHRGELKSRVIYVGHYNPWKPRGEAADRRVQVVGGNLRQFQVGAVHRLALSVPIDDHYLGGIVNKYFGKTTEPIYWAEWTNLSAE